MSGCWWGLEGESVEVTALSKPHAAPHPLSLCQEVSQPPHDEIPPGPRRPTPNPDSSHRGHVARQVHPYILLHFLSFHTSLPPAVNRSSCLTGYGQPFSPLLQHHTLSHLSQVPEPSDPVCTFNMLRYILTLYYLYPRAVERANFLGAASS